MWNDSTYFGIKSGWANDVPKGIDYGLDDFPIFHEKGEENLFVPHGLAGSGDSLVGPKGVGPVSPRPRWPEVRGHSPGSRVKDLGS